MVFPASHGILHTSVFSFVAKHTEQVPAEIGITARSYGWNKVDGRGVSVTSEVEPFVVEPMVARKSHAGINTSFLKS